MYRVCVCVRTLDTHTQEKNAHKYKPALAEQQPLMSQNSAYLLMMNCVVQGGHQSFPSADAGHDRVIMSHESLVSS